MLKRINREVWLSVLSAVLLIALWEASIAFGWVKSAFVVAPSAIAAVTIDMVQSGELLGDISVTLARMFGGFFIGTILGLLIGLAMGWSRQLRAILDPIVSVIYPLPKIALLPLIMLLVGIGECPMVIVIALAALFPVLVNSIAGVVNMDPIYFDAAQNYGASKFKVFTRVVLPGSLPVAFSGIRLALGLSLLTAVVVELAIASNGLGAILWLSWETLRVEKIYVAIVVIAVIGLLMNFILKLIGQRLAPWRGTII